VPAIYLHELIVPESDIDLQGHANNVAYLRWTQDAAVAHSASTGWTSEKYREYGVTWVARSHEIRYKHAAMQDDALVVRTWVESFRPASCLRKYEVTRSGDGKLLAEAMTEWAYVDLGSGRPKRVPDELAAAFKAADD
jgi:acyl-CoA thioester hydrolase